MRLPRLFSFRKSRKYPIKYDSEGWSLRSRCFAKFELRKRPTEVAKELNIQMDTVCRYFRDWQQLGPNFERKYAFAKELFKQTASDRDHNLELFAKTLGISKEELKAILSQPHGLKRLLTGKPYFPIQAETDHKLHVVLALAQLFAEHLIQNKGCFEDIYCALERLLQENKKCRDEEDAEIKEDNQFMPLIHKLLEAEIVKEQQSQIQPDTLSDQEINTVMKLEIESLKRKKEMLYWINIADLMDQGLTLEQACEKKCQDLIKKGNLKGAQRIREYLKKVQSAERNSHVQSPSSPPQPLSPA